MLSEMSSSLILFSFDIFYRISEDLDAVPLFIRYIIVFTHEGLFSPGPVRVVGIVIVSFRMGHKPEDSSGRITNPGNILHRAVRIFRPPALRAVTRFTGILHDRLVVLKKAMHVLL